MVPVSNRPLDEKKASQEHQLFEFTQRLAKFRAGRRAIHIHLSQLRAYNRRGHHIRIAVNTFEFLVKQMDGQIFALSNADLIFRRSPDPGRRRAPGKPLLLVVRFGAAI